MDREIGKTLEGFIRTSIEEAKIMSEFGSNNYPDTNIVSDSDFITETNNAEVDFDFDEPLEIDEPSIDEQFEGSMREGNIESSESLFEPLPDYVESETDGSADLADEIEADCNPDTIPPDLAESDEIQESIANEIREGIPDIAADESEDKQEELDGLVPSAEPNEYGKHLEKESLDQKENRDDRTVYMGLVEAMDTATEEEKAIYSELPLEAGEVDGRESLLRPDDDFLMLDENGQFALDRTQEGKAAIIDGEKVHRHHIGQMNDSPFAELTQSEHQENTKILHDTTIPSQVDRSTDKAEREHYWKARTQDIIERNIISDKK